MKRDAAEKFQILSMQFSGWLNGRLIDLQPECSEEEFKEMKLKFGTVMADVFLNIMKPIYLEHPDLKPEELGGTYKVKRDIYFDRDDGTFHIPK